MDKINFFRFQSIPTDRRYKLVQYFPLHKPLIDSKLVNYISPEYQDLNN